MEVASLAAQTLVTFVPRVSAQGPVREPSPVFRTQQNPIAFGATGSESEGRIGMARVGTGVQGFGNPIDPTSLSSLIGREGVGTIAPPSPSTGQRANPSQASVQQAPILQTQEERGQVQTAGPNESANRAVGEQAAPQDQTDPNSLTTEEEAEVQQLRARDLEVRRHEQAHVAAGGQYAGTPVYDYQRGPDGRQYAVGGEVSIDTRVIAGNPEANIRKFEQVRRAALAPLEPSPQDRRVAAEAQQQISASRIELRNQIAAERTERLEEAEVQRPTNVLDAPELRGIELRGIEPRGIEPLGEADTSTIANANANARINANANDAAQPNPRDDAIPSATNPQTLSDLAGLVASNTLGIADAASRGLQASQAFLRTEQLISSLSSARGSF